MDLFLVQLAVADWPTSLAWYRDRLGLTVVLMDEPNRYALLAAGPARIALKAGTPVPGTTRVVFHVRSVGAELTRLASAGIQPTGQVTESPEGYRVARFTDPDGHRLELFEWTGPNRPTSGGV